VAARNGYRPFAVRTAGILLSIAFAIVGLVIAFGAWSVGYCGSFTPDTGQPGTLRHDLCRGTSGDLMGGLVVVSWLWAAIAPALGAYLSMKRDSPTPLAVLTVLGAIPIATIAILAEVLPQG
jgi:hypothetical protein